MFLFVARLFDLWCLLFVSLFMLIVSLGSLGCFGILLLALFVHVLLWSGEVFTCLVPCFRRHLLCRLELRRLFYAVCCSGPTIFCVLSCVTLVSGFWLCGITRLFVVGCLLGFLAKCPVYFLHFWLPRAHVEASVVGSVVLASVLLKLGLFGLVRVTFGVVFIFDCVLFLLFVLFLGFALLLSLWCAQVL